MTETKFRPLVVGAPRSGFALLSSVVIHFLPHTNYELSLRQSVFNILLKGVGDHISDAIVGKFATHGITNDLLYNPNFRYVVGGPKWIPRNRQDTAFFRKYIGVKGKGDFTLVTSHPHEVLSMDEIVHSHTDPKLWLEHPDYNEFTKFASVRNPIDILNSSVFSLNALASEYIQKFIPPEQDNDNIRQQLALYKLTDLNFFEGLVKFLAGYFDEFVTVYDQYILMRWEDLIAQPVETIMRLARESGVSITEDYAREIWKKLDHVNLTQAHKHNYRVGHGVLNGWKNWITNHHLKMIKSYGFDQHMVKLGYGEISMLDESRYTDFQKKVSAFIDEGKVYNEFFDADLFTFAFNKSNLVSDKFPFKRYEWRTHTQIERSIFTDENMQDAIWSCAEEACGQLNQFLHAYLNSSKSATPEQLLDIINQLEKDYQSTIGETLDERYTSAFHRARGLINAQLNKNKSLGFLEKVIGKVRNMMPRNERLMDIESPKTLPKLIASEVACNVVEYNNSFYAIPHSIGPIELDKSNVVNLPGVFVSEHLEPALKYAKNYQ